VFCGAFTAYIQRNVNYPVDIVNKVVISGDACLLRRLLLCSAQLLRLYERALSSEEGLSSYVGGIFWGATAAIIIWIFSVYDDDVQARLKEKYGLDQIIESSNATHEESEYDDDYEDEYEYE
jgi:hypothetical protein